MDKKYVYMVKIGPTRQEPTPHLLYETQEQAEKEVEAFIGFLKTASNSSIEVYFSDDSSDDLVDENTGKLYSDGMGYLQCAWTIDNPCTKEHTLIQIYSVEVH